MLRKAATNAVVRRRMGIYIPVWLRTLAGQLTAVGSVLALAAAFGSLTWPLGDDQGIFTWAGSVINAGGVPYRDAWDIKGPLTYYVYSFALTLFGQPEFAIRTLDLALAVPCCWLLRRVTLRVNHGDTFGANCATIFFALAYYGWGIATSAQPDGWAAMLILATVAVLLSSSQNANRTMIVSGALIAAAGLLKPLYLIYLLLPAASLLDEQRSIAQRLRLLAICAFTAAATIGGAILVLRRLSGELSDFADILRFLLSSYLPQHNFPEELLMIPGTLRRNGVLIPFLLAPLGVWLIARAGLRREARLMASWLALAVIAVVGQGRYWPYQWIPAMLALAPTLGAAIAGAGRVGLALSVRLGGGKLALLVWLASVVPLAGRAVSNNTYDWPKYLLGWQTREEHIKSLTEPWPYWTFTVLATYVASHSEPEDGVLMWGWDTVVNVLSERKSPSRFGFSQPLVAGGPLREKYRRIFLKEIISAPPRYIIIQAEGPWVLFERSGLELLAGFPQFEQYLHTRYVLVNQMNGFQVWKAVR